MLQLQGDGDGGFTLSSQSKSLSRPPLIVAKFHDHSDGCQTQYMRSQSIFYPFLVPDLNTLYLHMSNQLGLESCRL